MNNKNIAILGSTSHLAKGLINKLLQENDFNLHLYTRSPDKVQAFLRGLNRAPDRNCVIHNDYSDFTSRSYDLVINCVGVGTANKLKGNYADWFLITEKYDNLVLEYLRRNCPDALYVSFSSGAVYGREFLTPAEENTANRLKVNKVVPEDYYGIARLNAEAKHRALPDLRIVDLRVFSYFSRYIDLTDGYFIAEVVNCVLKKKVLATNEVNIVRDYVHPADLFSLVMKCLATDRLNTAFDVTSARPVTKREILEYFSAAYGLKYDLNRPVVWESGTGPKGLYYSRYLKAAEIGYQPKFCSLETIKQEAKWLLEDNNHE